MHGYASVQGQNGWFYQTKTQSGGWSNLALFNDEVQAWLEDGDPTNAWVSRIEMCTLLPGVTVARTWQAKRAGSVAVRGRALKSYAVGAVARVQITLNDRVIWEAQTIAAADREGAETNLDNLAVEKGDMIRFEVQGAADGLMDAISWAPTIAYFG